MNINEDLTLSPGDEELIKADQRRYRRNRPAKPGSWASNIVADPFLIDGLDVPVPF